MKVTIAITAACWVFSVGQWHWHTFRVLCKDPPVNCVPLKLQCNSHISTFGEFKARGTHREAMSS